MVQQTKKPAATREAETKVRRARYRLGLSSETIAGLLLRLKGYQIIDRRYRSPVGEIDLVARRGRRLAFVEVKRRATLDAAFEAVTDRQRRRVERAAELWLKQHPRYAVLDYGFDIIALAPRHWPRHERDAFPFRSRWSPTG